MLGVVRKALAGRKAHRPEGAPSRGAAPRTCRVPEDRLVYAIGDIHGRADLLANLIEEIWKDSDKSESADVHRPDLIFLGDYVDKGPASKQVVSFITALAEVGKFNVVPLLGNHERTMLDFIADPQIGPTWLAYGGGVTLNSYGVAVPGRGAGDEDWAKAAEDLTAALPERHRKFFGNLRLHHEIGDYVFVHAGVRQGVPLERQSESDLLWIRDEFLNSDAWHGKMIVHGHTPTETPTFKSNRIGLDTGAYATNVLTALRLRSNSQEILQSR
jgi:serine/threonine protein phosphatase 1